MPEMDEQYYLDPGELFGDSKKRDGFPDAVILSVKELLVLLAVGHAEEFQGYWPGKYEFPDSKETVLLLHGLMSRNVISEDGNVKSPYDEAIKHIRKADTLILIISGKNGGWECFYSGKSDHMVSISQAGRESDRVRLRTMDLPRFTDYLLGLEDCPDIGHGLGAGGNLPPKEKKRFLSLPYIAGRDYENTELPAGLKLYIEWYSLGKRKVFRRLMLVQFHLRNVLLEENNGKGKTMLWNKEIFTKMINEVYEDDR